MCRFLWISILVEILEIYPALCGYCKSGEFSCSNGVCVPLGATCNGRNNCGDYGSDEDSRRAGCICGPNGSALPRYRCLNGRCILSSQKCDGINHCGDYSDESWVARCYTDCDSNEFECHNSKECIPLNKTCNKINNCGDWSDEANKECSHLCGVGDFRCHNGQCIAYSLRCNDYNDCEDGSDEEEKSCSAPGTIIDKRSANYTPYIAIGAIFGGVATVTITFAVIVKCFCKEKETPDTLTPIPSLYRPDQAYISNSRSGEEGIQQQFPFNESEGATNAAFVLEEKDMLPTYEDVQRLPPAYQEAYLQKGLKVPAPWAGLPIFDEAVATDQKMSNLNVKTSENPNAVAPSFDNLAFEAEIPPNAMEDHPQRD